MFAPLTPPFLTPSWIHGNLFIRNFPPRNSNSVYNPEHYMDIFFQDPTDIPLPPEEVRIRELTAEPWPDGQRVRVSVELTPFQTRPNGEINISNEDEEEVASVSFIETIDPKMEFTLHLRTPETPGDYSVNAIIFYPILTNGQELGETQNQEPLPLPQNIKVVDQSSTKFTIPTNSES